MKYTSILVVPALKYCPGLKVRFKGCQKVNILFEDVYNLLTALRLTVLPSAGEIMPLAARAVVAPRSRLDTGSLMGKKVTFDLEALLAKFGFYSRTLHLIASRFISV
jgi:hypothetical protein